MSTPISAMITSAVRVAIPWIVSNWVSSVAKGTRRPLDLRPDGRDRLVEVIESASS